MNWCRDYLSNHELKVVIDGKSSDWDPIPSGVPQGSLLGSLFFVIFINDLPDVASATSLVALYADDCKTSRVIQHPCDHESLQDDLNSLVSCSPVLDPLSCHGTPGREGSRIICLRMLALNQS